MAGPDPMKSKFGYHPESDKYDGLCNTYNDRKGKLDAELALPKAQQNKEKIKKLREITKNLENIFAQGGYKLIADKKNSAGQAVYRLAKAR